MAEIEHEVALVGSHAILVRSEESYWKLKRATAAPSTSREQGAGSREQGSRGGCGEHTVLALSRQLPSFSKSTLTTDRFLRKNTKSASESKG